MKEIHEQVWDEMKRQGMKQKELAKLSGVGPGLICDWLKGRHDMGFLKLVKILKALKIKNINLNRKPKIER